MKSLTTVECVEDLALLQEGLVEPLQAQAYQLTNLSCHSALHDTACKSLITHRGRSMILLVRQ